MVKINQRHVEPYMSNCLLWQRSFSFSNESLPDALFFSLAFLIPFAHPLDSSSYSTLLLLLPSVSSLASHLLLLPMIHVAPQMLPCLRVKVDTRAWEPAFFHHKEMSPFNSRLVECGSLLHGHGHPSRWGARMVSAQGSCRHGKTTANTTP